MRALAPLALACALFAGCAVGPRYDRPPVTAPEQARGQAGPPEAASLADPAWWQIFQDEALKSLIGEAIRNAYDVRLAAWPRDLEGSALGLRHARQANHEPLFVFAQAPHCCGRTAV